MFPIAYAVDAIRAFEERRARAQRLMYFGFAPTVKLAFLAFAVGVEGSVANFCPGSAL